jgi:hypothetical protein
MQVQLKLAYILMVIDEGPQQIQELTNAAQSAAGPALLA